MSKNILLVSLALCLLLVGAAWWFAGGLTGKNATVDSTKTVLFYGLTCPDCQTTDQWFNGLKVANKISFEHFERKEVNTPAAQTELQQVASFCRLNTSQGIILPVLFTAGKCYVGTSEIEGYFKDSE